MQSCLNMGGPSSIAILSIDRIVNQYREGKAKEPRRGEEIEPETAYVQAVGAPQGVTAYLLYNGSASYFQWRG